MKENDRNLQNTAATVVF